MTTKKRAAMKAKKIVSIKKKRAAAPKRKGARGFAEGTYLASPNWSPEWVKLIMHAGSSAKLAKALGTTQMSLVRWAKGVVPNAASLEKIANYCKVYGLRVPKF